ncbi:MAG: hypothetical protein ABGY75_04810 [Gemmataceae bacterium]
MRFRLDYAMIRTPVLLLLVATTVPAAPVPEPKLTEAKAAAWDKLWAQAGLWEEPFQVELICRLLKEPKPGAEFLRGKLPPLQLSEKEAKELIAQLGSEKEEEWKAAYRELRKRDVRLKMTLRDAWAETTTPEQRRRLVAVTAYWGGQYDTPEQWEEEFRRIRADGDVPFPSEPNDLAEWQERNPTAFEAPRVRLMLRTLEAMGAPEARAVVERMATGNPDVRLTKEAAVIGKRMKASKPTADSRMAAGLRMLHFWQRPRGEPLNPADLAAFVSHPDLAVAFLKANLRPLKLTRNEGETLLARLFADDPNTVRAALRALQKPDIRAAMTLEDAWALAASPDHRGRLVLACTTAWETNIGSDLDADVGHKLIDYELRNLAERAMTPGWCAVAAPRPGVVEKHPLVGHPIHLGNTLRDTYRNGRWEREAVGLHILDVIGTAEAVAVIQDVASGHPDAHPTTVAKWVLKRKEK